MKIAALLLAGVLLCSSAAAQNGNRLQLDVVPENSQGKAVLLLQLRNVDGIARKLMSGSLPWVDGVSGIQLRAYSGDLARGDQSLNGLRKIGALLHGYQEITIDPGAVLKGEIDLNERFAGINELLKTQAVFIVWNYVPFDTSLPSKPEELSGAVYLQQRAQ